MWAQQEKHPNSSDGDVTETCILRHISANAGTHTFIRSEHLSPGVKADHKGA